VGSLTLQNVSFVGNRLVNAHFFAQNYTYSASDEPQVNVSAIDIRFESNNLTNSSFLLF
jgi:hypothetical protein